MPQTTGAGWPPENLNEGQSLLGKERRVGADVNTKSMHASIRRVVCCGCNARPQCVLAISRCQCAANLHCPRASRYVYRRPHIYLGQ